MPGRWSLPAGLVALSALVLDGAAGARRSQIEEDPDLGLPDLFDVKVADLAPEEGVWGGAPKERAIPFVVDPEPAKLGDPLLEICCCRGPAKELCRRFTRWTRPAFDAPANGLPMKCPPRSLWEPLNKVLPGTYAPGMGPAQCLSDFMNPVPKNITIKAYWMRHGWSCANAKQEGASRSKAQIVNRAKAAWYKDPPLTDLAIARAMRLGERVKKRILAAEGEMPMVFSSTMLRAMETALWNFPESQIRPMPYIAEMGASPDNVPNAWEQQEAMLNAHGPNSGLAERVVFEAYAKDHAARSTLTLKSHYRSFLQYFPGALVEILDHGEKIKDGAVIPVVVVSHSHFMQANLGCGKLLKRKPRNNEVWVQNYTVGDISAWDAEMKAVDCEPLTAEEDYFPKTPDRICLDDVQRCHLDRPEAWLRETQSWCDALDEAAKKDVYVRDLRANETYTQRDLE